MKKVLVLALVLTVAAFANAGQIWTISGSTATQSAATGWEVKAGDVLTMVLSVDASFANGVIIDYIADGGATGNITNVVLPAAFDTGTGPGYTGSGFDAFLASNEGPASGLAAGDWAFINMVAGGTGKTASGIMAISYTVGAGSGLVTLSAGKFDWLNNDDTIKILTGAQAMAPIALNVVPEPVTVALLGLGGLLIRRRKVA